MRQVIRRPIRAQAAGIAGEYLRGLREQSAEDLMIEEKRQQLQVENRIKAEEARMSLLQARAEQEYKLEQESAKREHDFKLATHRNELGKSLETHKREVEAQESARLVEWERKREANLRQQIQVSAEEAKKEYGLSDEELYAFVYNRYLEEGLTPPGVEFEEVDLETGIRHRRVLGPMGEVWLDVPISAPPEDDEPISPERRAAMEYNFKDLRDSGRISESNYQQLLAMVEQGRVPAEDDIIYTDGMDTRDEADSFVRVQMLELLGVRWKVDDVESPPGSNIYIEKITFTDIDYDPGSKEWDAALDRMFETYKNNPNVEFRRWMLQQLQAMVNNPRYKDDRNERLDKFVTEFNERLRRYSMNTP